MLDIDSIEGQCVRQSLPLPLSPQPSALGPQPSALGPIVATTWAATKRQMAYAINVIRAPLFPLMFFTTSYLAYNIAGRDIVDGVNVAGFLLIGMFGLEAAGTAVWASGYAIESERAEGTIAALFLAPASRWAVVMGHGFAGLVSSAPSLVVLALVGVVSGAELDVASPAAFALAAIAICASSLAVGFALASLFVLTRHGNLVANVIQQPLYLLGGFVIPRAALPSWLAPLSDAFPIAHATDALRDAALSGASLGDIGPSLGAAAGLSAIYIALGILLLSRVEHAVKRSGELDFY